MRLFRLACRFAASPSCSRALSRLRRADAARRVFDARARLRRRAEEGFEADNPDIEIVWQRELTGVITARLLAERGERGDAIWGLAATSMMRLKKEALLKPHAPPNLAAIRPNFRDAETPPAWVGMEAWAAAVCFNTVEAEKLGLPKPASWYDLLDPRFSGRITMPDPGSSGTGYFHVSAWIQMFGEEEAWGSWTGCTQYRRLRALRDEAVPQRRGGRVPGRHLLRARRRPGEGEGRADGRPADEGGRRLGHGRGRPSSPAPGTPTRPAGSSISRRAARRTRSMPASSSRWRSRASRSRSGSTRKGSPPR